MRYFARWKRALLCTQDACATLPPSPFTLLTSLLLLLFLTPLLASAATPAGVRILNQASASFEWAGRSWQVTSNLVYNYVAPVHGFEILPNGTVEDPGLLAQTTPGSTVYLSYTLFNRGNTTGSYDIRAVFLDQDSDFEPFMRMLRLDVNSDGRLDVGETDRSAGILSNVPPGGRVQFLLIVEIPPTALDGQRVHFDLQGFSRESDETDILNVARILVSQDGYLTLRKDANPVVVPAGELVTYQLDIANPSGVSLSGVTVEVDGIQRSGVFVQDPIPDWASGAMTYLPGSLQGNPAGMALLSTDGGNTWVSTTSPADEPLSSNVTNVGYLWGGSFRDGQSASFTFTTRVNPDQPRGRIANRGVLEFTNRRGERMQDESTNTVFVEVTTERDEVFIGPQGQPRAAGPTSTNDDFTFDPGINPESPNPFQVAGNTITFFNTVENGSSSTDTIRITIDNPPISASNSSSRRPRRATQTLAEARAEDLPPTTFPASWGVQLLQADGVSTLHDTDGDGFPDSGPLAAGGTYTIAVKVTIPPSWREEDLPPDGWQGVMRATSVNNPASFNLTVNRLPQVRALLQFWDSFEKILEGPEILQPGDRVRYTNRFGHSGDTLVFNAVIVDTLDDSLTDIQDVTTGLIQNQRGPEQILVEGSYNAEKHEIVWNIPQIPTDFLGEISFSAAISESALNGEEIPNTFTITSDKVASVRSSNRVTALVAPNAVIDLAKTANRDDAEPGDPVLYTINLSNAGPTEVVENVQLRDILPRGVRYLAGTARLDGELAEPRIAANGRELFWDLPDMPVNRNFEITYGALITSDALEGDGLNTAIASVIFPSGTPYSTEATHRMQLREGIFDDLSLVFGRVYIDMNDNREHDFGEPAIPGVRLYLDDGTTVLTDRNGMYHIEGVSRGRGTRVIRLDESTLPAGYELADIDSANAGNPHSRFLDLRFGTPHKANFRVRPPEERLLPAATEEQPAQVKLAAFDAVAGQFMLHFDRPTAITSWYEASSRTLHLTLNQAVLAENSTGAKGDFFEDEAARIESYFFRPDTPNRRVHLRLRLAEAWGEWHPQQLRLQPTSLSLSPDFGDLAEQSDQSDRADLADQSDQADLSEEVRGPLIEYPGDGEAFIARSRISVGVSAHLAAQFELRLNGQAVPAAQIGTKTYRVRERRSFFEFVGVPLEPGENTLEWQTTEPGRGPEVQSIKVFRAAAPERIELGSSPQRLIADGTSETTLAIRLLDKNGVPSGEASVISVAVDGAEIISEDFRQMEPLHQVQIRDGIGRVRLAPVGSAGNVLVDITAGPLTVREVLQFQPHLRDWIVVGEADLTVARRLDRQADEAQSTWQNEEEGRVGVFVKGKIGEDILLTGNYDSTREWEKTDLFREYEPERFYPVFGDGTEPTYEAASRDPYFLKLERGQSHVMYGDIWTDLRETELGAYNRSLTGARTELLSDYIDLKAFVAKDDQRQVRFEVQGAGVSGYYKLPNTNILLNSEEILLQVRDRNFPELVVTEERLSRNNDYSIDYYLGRVLFKRPIPSTDENFNPVVLVFRYEVDNERGGEFLTYGGRLALHDKERRHSLGLTQVTEQNETRDHQLHGVDASVQLTEKIAVVGEYMESRDAEGLQDRASRAELKGNWENADLRLYYQDVGENFNNPNTRGNLGGRETFGVEASFRPAQDWELKTQAYRQKMALAGSTEDVFIQDINFKSGRADYLLGGGFVRESVEALEGNPDSPNALVGTRENPFVKIGIGTSLTDKFRAQVLHQQSLSNDVTRDQSTRTSVDLLYQLYEHTALALTLERRELLDGFQDSLLFGSETKYYSWLTGTHKYALDGHTSGRRGRAINGLQADYPVSDQLSLLGTLEISTLLHEAVSADSIGQGDDFWAASTGFRYVQRNEHSLTGRVEVRMDDRSEDYFTELGGTRRFGPDNTFFARNRIHLAHSLESGENRWRLDFLTGYAYRPVHDDTFNYFTDFRVEYENGGPSSGIGRLDKYVWTNDFHYGANEFFLTEWRYAAKVVEGDVFGGSFFSDLVATRWRADFNKRTFAAAGLRVMRDHAVDTASLSYGLELGFRPAKDFILAIGYNFDGFKDYDFSRGEHWEKGFYLSFRLKFDESILGILNRLEGSGTSDE